MKLLSAVRSLLFVLWLAVTVIPWALAVLVASLFLSSTQVYWMCAGWLKVAIWGARVICGVRYRVTGMDHVPTAAQGRAAVLLAPKHQSTWETFAFPAIMPHPLAYVFKRELLYVPFFGWAMGRLDMIHIDRSKRAEAWDKVAEQGRRIMGNGGWVIMFPEGTRTDARPPGHLQERRGAPGHRHRHADRADRRQLGALLAAQELPAAARPDRRVDRPADPGRGPRARRTDARGRDLDRGRDAAHRSRGLPARARSPPTNPRRHARRRPRRSPPAVAVRRAAVDRRQRRRSNPRRLRHRLRRPIGAAALPAHPRAQREVAAGRTPCRLRAAARAPAQHRLHGRTRRAWPSARRAGSTLADIDDGAAREGAPGSCASCRSSRSARAGSRPRSIDWRDGTAMPFLGETVILVLDPRASGAVLNTDATALPGVPRLTLHLGLPRDGHARAGARHRAELAAAPGAAHLRGALRASSPQRLGVRVRRLALSSAATRWGSASADGSIRLHWRLVHFGLPVIDYVVTHELAHLREMNHSPALLGRGAISSAGLRDGARRTARRSLARLRLTPSFAQARNTLGGCVPAAQPAHSLPVLSCVEHRERKGQAKSLPFSFGGDARARPQAPGSR